MPLKRYHAKRSFAQTPEPRGVAYPTTQQRFVIQKHAASSLHYDLRLERQGVMQSWAVPKGPSEDPRLRHLAAQTEDHPLEYRHFEGVIPQGYGAGTVLIWDQGTFEWVGRGRDHLSFFLHGRKLRGEYVLVKFGKAGQKSWILFKKHDRFARQRSITKLKPNSVVTGRSLFEVEQGSPAKKAYLTALAGAKPASLPRHLLVQKPTLIAKPFSDPEWLFESKWGGLRSLAFFDGQRLRLVGPNNLDLLARFPELKELSQSLAARRALLDGEVVGPTFKVFDLLYLDGFDLRRVPLLQRKALLRAILRPQDVLHFSDHVEGAGEQFFKQTQKLGLEGMLAKDITSIYEPGKRTRTWLEVRSAVRERPQKLRLISKAPREQQKQARKISLNPALISAREANQSIKVNSVSLPLTNLNKPFWLRPRILKRDVLNYYYTMAAAVLPHLHNRPLTLKRYPNGVAGGFFYQKNAPAPRPRFVKTVVVQHSQGPTRYVLCDDLPTLIWLANLADLELHPWYSRAGGLNHPDFVVFDLDPSRPGDLPAVRQVALLIRDVLSHCGLKSYPKSSGSRGIHIYVPIAARFTYEQTKLFAKGVTQVVHHVAPRQTTLEFYKARRRGVYIDYL
ncbi:MAG: DNA polymerase ligase N-terminal domain-containing protein, partial [Parcubacteria group bacterium]